MTKDEKITFFQTLPTFRQIQANLYRTRRELIPANPHSQSDLNISSEWFLFYRKSGESFVKGDCEMSNGRRILVFSSDESLKILARPRTILGGGTFRVTPSLWYQTFIISAEVDEAVHVPVMFCLTKGKQLMKTCLES